MNGPYTLGNLPEELADFDFQVVVDVHEFVRLIGQTTADELSRFVFLQKKGQKISVVTPDTDDYVRVSIRLNGNTPDDEMTMIYLSSDGKSYFFWDSKVSINVLKELSDAYKKAIELSKQKNKPK